MLRNGWMELNAVSFSPSGSHFVTGDNMGELHLWNMENVKVCRVKYSFGGVYICPS